MNLRKSSLGPQNSSKKLEEFDTYFNLTLTLKMNNLSFFLIIMIEDLLILNTVRKQYK